MFVCTACVHRTQYSVLLLWCQLAHIWGFFIPPPPLLILTPPPLTPLLSPPPLSPFFPPRPPYTPPLIFPRNECRLFWMDCLMGVGLGWGGGLVNSMCFGGYGGCSCGSGGGGGCCCFSTPFHVSSTFVSPFMQIQNKEKKYSFPKLSNASSEMWQNPCGSCPLLKTLFPSKCSYFATPSL